MMGTDLPDAGLQLRSTVTAEGRLVVDLAEVAVPRPGASQVVVRVEAAPVNPSDIMPMLAGADPSAADFGGTADRPVVTIALPAEARPALSGRVGQPLPIGLEGAGVVVAAGADAQHLLGKRVAFLSLMMGAFAQYCTVSMTDCAPLPEGVTARQGADVFCNPLTALAIVETLHQTGRKALVHTAAASNLGQMLVRICREDGIGLVNVVRKAEHVELLRSLGAEHVCNSTDPAFEEDLAGALAATGATVAFDAIGGGPMASRLLKAMEAAAAARMPAYSPYGSTEMKTVYVYGELDHSPLPLTRESYGMLWGVEGWAMPPILERAGPERAMQLTRRVLDGITTTFASSYGHEVSLAEALRSDVMHGYCRKATGQKYLINPAL